MTVTGVRKIRFSWSLNAPKLIVTLKQHWITGIIRLFDAFVYSPSPLHYYADTSHVTQLVKNVFLSSSAVIGDALIVSPSLDKAAI